jgi:cell division protein FtsQ
MNKAPLKMKGNGKGNKRRIGKESLSSGSRLIRPLGQGLVKGIFFLSVVVIISLSFLFLYHTLQRSRHLRLERVVVQGVEGKIRNELIKMCDLNSDLSMLALKLKALKKEMEKHPWVRTVTLERRFPNTLIIRAEKERALALAVLDGLYCVNPWGEIFKKVHTWDDLDFPIITGLCRGPDFRSSLMRAIRVIKALEREKGMWSMGELSEIHVKRGKGMSLYFSHLAAEIKLISENVESKMAVLKKVARHLRQKGRMHQVKGIDLNYSGEAVVSFRKG